MVIGVGIIVLAGRFVIRCFTNRAPFLLLMYSDLQNYAADHNGCFPQSEKGPYAALQKLYPRYSDGQGLAGLSGDVHATVECLKNGEPLTSNLTSWVYIQGLKNTDNPKLAIFWEARGGVYANGQKDVSGGHCVMLLNGEAGQISGADWTNFLEQQERLRKITFKTHNAAKVPSATTAEGRQ
jgi:hypothetical protein